MRPWLPLIALLMAASACGSSTPSTPTTSSAPYSQTDLVVGTGAQVNTGNRAVVSYTGWLYDTSKTDGKGAQFDSGSGLPFTVGAGQMIAGWDRGVPGMRVGGQRRLIIPPELAYGSAGRAPIPPNATLVFDITLTAIQ
jgi:FKBP-type peptidyl-prolyl cis-trans isomerase FkpA